MPQMISQKSFAARDQAAHTIPLAPQQRGEFEVAPFSNNQEHLEALEREARLLLACALLRRKDWQDKAEYIQPTFLQLPAEETNPKRLEELLSLEMARNRAREEVSMRSGTELLFCRLCRDYGLEEFDRTAVLLL